MIRVYENLEFEVTFENADLQTRNSTSKFTETIIFHLFSIPCLITGNRKMQAGKISAVIR